MCSFKEERARTEGDTPADLALYARILAAASKDGPDSVFQKELLDVSASHGTHQTDQPVLNADIDSSLPLQADILITTPFHPGYLTADLLKEAKSPKLKLAVTAGVGSDHVDLDAANLRGITVAEVSGSNVVSVAEHVMMSSVPHSLSSLC